MPAFEWVSTERVSQLVDAAYREGAAAERERCRDRINALIELQGAATGTKRWHVARISALMAARSAVMRGDDDGAPPL